MPQTFVEPQNISENRFTVRGPEAHHLVRVLRCQVEDPIQLFDGTGRQYRAVVSRIDSKEPLIEGHIIEVVPLARSHRYLRLFQGLPKGSKFDYVIEKAIELGVDEIIPFLSQKSQIKLTPVQSDGKVARWGRLAMAAAKQSNRKTIPSLASPVSLTDLGSQITKGFSLLFSQDPKSSSLRNVLKSAHALPESARINIIIGPESGLSEKEVSWLVGLGAHLVSLGDLTLRAETAGLVAASILNYEFQRI